MAHMRFDERRQQLIDAAVMVISTEGVAQASTRRIAAEVGAPLASLHYTFRTKGELLDAVVRQCLDSTDALYTELVPAGCGLESAIRNLIEGFVDWAVREPAVF